MAYVMRRRAASCGREAEAATEAEAAAKAAVPKSALILDNVQLNVLVLCLPPSLTLSLSHTGHTLAHTRHNWHSSLGFRGGLSSVFGPGSSIDFVSN